MLVFLPTTAHPDSSTEDTTPNTCDSHVVRFHKVKAKGLARATYAERKWQDQTPAKRGQHRWFRWHILCIYDPPTDHRLRAFKKKQKAAFYRWRAYRLVAPYRGFKGEGRWLRWLAIPKYVVQCESGDNLAEIRAWGFRNRWQVESSDGGLATYQHTPWASGRPVPWPVRGYGDKLKHHQTAADMWAGGSGASQWHCA